MACGKPVVGTDAGGLAYLITKEGGCKVPPNDSQALADALIEILASKNLQISMGNYNRNLIETTYDWEKIIDKLESIYAEIIIGF
jgi:glycosyltransferase involved in cell wall biosynthesis